MPDREGTPIWYELLSDDPDAARAFYADVVGWDIAPGATGAMDYRIITAPDGERIAGLMQRPDGVKNGPTWLGYIGVRDVDATVAAITDAGGAVHMPATTMEGVGRMAMVADPQGAVFYVMRGAGDEASHAFATRDEASPGHAVWNELTAADPEAAIAFYADLFGWRQDGAMPMGELGDYRFLHSGSTCLGAVMGRTPNGRDGWQFYFLVPEIDAAGERLAAGGGTMIQGPDAIPGGGFSLVAKDPQGARFGLVGPRKA